MNKQRWNHKKRSLGQGMTEYIIITALIAIAAIGVYTYFGDTIRAQTAAMALELSGQDGTKQNAEAVNAAKKADGNASKHKSLKDFANNE